MAHAIRIHSVGGPDVLTFDEVTVGAPGAGEARLRHTAIGLNYIDTYHRTGQYPLPLPAGIGLEAAGVVEAVGSGVDWIKPGDRVAYCGGTPGAYSTERVMAADRLVKIPDGIDDVTAATLMLKGLTVQYLFRQTFPLKGGETILFHAAAGGVGLIACQWARALGVTMIGTVGSDAKAELAKAHGCTHTIVYTREDFVARTKEFTGGKGVPVVYDSIGKDTFPQSLDCLQTPRHVRELRCGVGADRGVQHRPAGAEGFAVRDAADAVQLRGYARESLRDGRRHVRAGARGQDQVRGTPDVRAEGCGRRAPRAGSARHDGRDGADALISAATPPR